MHTQTINRLKQSPEFVRVSSKNQQRVWWVMILTAITMVAEITAGWWFGSMALLADGWHMSTHMVALGITLFAWHYAVKHKDDPKFSFSTGKVSVLAGYSSALFLVAVAVLMVVESISRFINPHDIAFDQAIMVAVIGLIVNLISAWLLSKEDHSGEDSPLANAAHSHAGHSHSHGSHSHGKDANHQAAFLHVLADAVTSIAAILALLAGKWLGWNWMDPMMGVIGGIIILIWAKGLLKMTSGVLLDHSLAEKVRCDIVQTLEADTTDKVMDLRTWRVSEKDYVAVIAIVSDTPQSPEWYKAKLQDFLQLKHITIEVNTCDDDSCEAKMAMNS